MKINGKDLIITPASFAEAKNLERAMGQAISRSQLTIDLGEIDLSKGSKQDKMDVKGETIGDILKSLINVGVSKDVEDALFVCAKRVVLGSGADAEVINEEFFDKIENRKFYYPIMLEIAKVNIYPFIEGLFSQFGGLTKILGSFLKSK